MSEFCFHLQQNTASLTCIFHVHTTRLPSSILSIILPPSLVTYWLGGSVCVCVDTYEPRSCCGQWGQHGGQTDFPTPFVFSLSLPLPPSWPPPLPSVNKVEAKILCELTPTAQLIGAHGKQVLDHKHDVSIFQKMSVCMWVCIETQWLPVLPLKPLKNSSGESARRAELSSQVIFPQYHRFGLE